MLSRCFGPTFPLTEFSPGTAAECQGRLQLEVEDVADGALAGRHVDQRAAALHQMPELLNALHIGFLRIKHAGVSESAEIQKRLRILESGVEILYLIKSEHRRKFLAGERIIGSDAFCFGDQDLAALRHLDARHRRNLECGLSDDRRIEPAVDENRLADFLLFIGLENISAAFDEFRLDFIINFFNDRDGLLRSADHAVVESFALENRADGKFDIAGLVHDDRRISGADAQCGDSAGVSRLDHAGAAGRENHIDVGMAHETLAQCHRRFFDPPDNAFRSAGFDGCVQHELRGGDRALLGAGMRAEDDSVACLERNQGFEDRGGGRVGGRDDSRDESERFGNGVDAERLIMLQNSAGLHIFVLMINVFGGEVVLDDLVFDYAHAGFFHRHFGEFDTCIVGGESSGAEDCIDLLLGKLGVFALSLFDGFDGLVENCELLRFQFFFRRGRIFHFSCCFSFSHK